MELSANRKLTIMEFRRFFAQPHSRVGDTIELTDEYNHIARVLRLKIGDKIVVCLNDGIEHLCEISSIDKTAVWAKILQSQPCASENSFSTTLFVGALKGDKNDFVVQKAVELGANRIVFFESKYTVSKFDTHKIERLNRISLEASKQCGRALHVPVDYTTLKNLSTALNNFDKSIVCFEREQHNTINQALNTSDKNIALVIGSEGGFDDSEIQLLAQVGCQIVTLGRRILRAETVPVYCLSVLDNLLNFGKKE